MICHPISPSPTFSHSSTFDRVSQCDQARLADVLRERLFGQSAPKAAIAIFEGMDALEPQMGSVVVLDVKGENFRETSRFRASMGDKVFRFAPTDWDRPTHRYNPLARLAAMTNSDRQQMELKLTAKLFLQTDNEKLSGLLAGGIDLFVAAGQVL